MSVLSWLVWNCNGAKSGSVLALATAWAAPILGIIGGITAQWLIVRSAPTQRERRIKKVSFALLWLFVLVWFFAVQPAVRALSNQLQWSDHTFFAVMSGFWWFYAMFVATLTIVMFRRMFALCPQSDDPVMASPPSRSRRVVLLIGVYLACAAWMINLAWLAGDRSTAAFVTVAMLVLGTVNFDRVHNSTSREAVLRVTSQHLALVWAVVLLTLNCRLDLWVASFRDIPLAEMHQLLPPSIIDLLTVVLLLWAGILVAATRPDRGRPSR